MKYIHDVFKRELKSYSNEWVFVKYSLIDLVSIIDEVQWSPIVCTINKTYNDEIAFYLLMRAIVIKQGCWSYSLDKNWPD